MLGPKSSLKAEAESNVQTSAEAVGAADKRPPSEEIPASGLPRADATTKPQEVSKPTPSGAAASPDVQPAPTDSKGAPEGCAEAAAATAGSVMTVAAGTAAGVAGSKPDGRRVELRVLYGSTTGTARRFAKLLADEAPAQAFHSGGGGGEGGGEGSSGPAGPAPLVVAKPLDCDGADAWDLLEPSDALREADPGASDVELVVVVLLATWTGGVAPMTATRWCEALRDMASDFRVGSAALRGARFAVYGLGSRVYDEDW